MSQKDVVICNPVRTAIGTYGGSLKDMPAPDLGATVIRETLKRSGWHTEDLVTVSAAGKASRWRWKCCEVMS